MNTEIIRRSPGKAAKCVVVKKPRRPAPEALTGALWRGRGICGANRQRQGNIAGNQTGGLLTADQGKTRSSRASCLLYWSQLWRHGVVEPAAPPAVPVE